MCTRMLRFGLALTLGVSPGSAEGQRQRVALALPGAQIVMDTIGERVTVNARPGELYAAAALVLQNFGIPTDVRDSVGGLLGTLRFVRSRQLNRTPLSVFLSCGSSMTGLRADYYRLTMPLLLMIDPLDAERSHLRIALVASAQDPTGSSNQPVLCGSTGGLEARLRKAIDSQLLVLKAAKPE